VETIRIENLSKSYGRLRVLNKIDLSVRAGEVTAILGPNASGKTTLLKCILGLVVPDDGEVYVNGKNVKEGYSYRADIGYMPQEASFPDNLTARDLFKLISDIRGIHPEAEVHRLTKLFKVEDFMDRPLGSLSGGTRQKVSAILALAFEPAVLILDEPTVGLDPVASTRLKREILLWKERKRTVVLTSHIMSEVEELADRVVLLIDGRIKIDSTVGSLKEKTDSETLEEAIASLLEVELA